MNPHLTTLRNASRLRPNRRGSLTTEAIVSAVILLVGIGIVGKSSYNFRRLWEDTRRFQLASDELANQMQRLNRLPKDQVTTALSSIAVSQEIAEILPSAEIQGQLIEDSMGARIRLAIDWKRVGSGEPLVLIGWLRNLSTPVVDAPIAETNSEVR